MPPRRTLAHVGVSVPDLAQGVAFYERVLGFDRIMGPIELLPGAGHAGTVAQDVFGDEFSGLRQVHLSGANGTGIEVFEFDGPRRTSREPGMDWTSGFFHVCIVERDVDGMMRDIERAGGRRRTGRVWDLFPGEPYRMAYCEDPFGNVIEVYSHAYETIYANRRPS